MAPLRSIRHPLLRFAQANGHRRTLVVEAVACLIAARLALLLVPFARLASFIGTFTAPHQARAATANAAWPPDAPRIAAEVGWAVTRAARYLPVRSVCLPQALAARLMLKRRGIASVLHFGSAPPEAETMATHAWLDAAGVEVTGYPVAQRFTEVACFV